MNTKQKVILRADGNIDIGLGHVMRCIALAEMLNNDFHVIFATLFLTDHLRSQILNVCAEITELPQSEDHYRIFSSQLSGNEIVVLDNYFFDTSYQQAIREKGCRLVCIDDIPNRHFVADAVINHGGGIDRKEYSLAPHTCLYTGPQYALIRSAFIREIHVHDDRSAMFICMGGADKYNATIQTLELLENAHFQQICNVVVGDAFMHQDELNSFCERSALQIKIHKNLSAEKMAEVMFECKYAICPPSTVSYEYLSKRGGELYLKMIAGNQKKLYTFYLDNKIAFDLSELFVTDKNRIRQSIAVQDTYFGKNTTESVLSIFRMLEREFHLKLRKASQADTDLYFQWVNDLDERKNAISTKHILYEDHVAWFAKKIDSKDAYLWILEYNNIPVGQIRFDIDREQNKATISYFIDRAYRGQGFGLAIVKMGLDLFAKQEKQILTINSIIRRTNITSCKIFERLNFEMMPIFELDNQEFVKYRVIC